eukprot:10824274-Alexandrium_andersonii.AAC.1
MENLDHAVVGTDLLLWLVKTSIGTLAIKSSRSMGPRNMNEWSGALAHHPCGSAGTPSAPRLKL